MSDSAQTIRARLRTIELGWKVTAMSFGIYLVGFLILIGGLIYGAVLLHMPSHWIVVGTIVLLGLGILKGVASTRQKDPS